MFRLFRLVSSLLFCLSAHAYTSRPAASQLVAKFGVESANPAASRVSYDLGLGKNPPVVQSSSSITPWDVQRATAFLVDHEAVNKIPHPPMLSAATHNTKPKREVKPLIPIRLADDILHISQGHASETPTMIPVGGDSFDLNTPWVEMLIHEQRQKLSIA